MKLLKINLVLFLFMAGFAFGGTVKNYTADLMDINAKRIVGKVYVKEDKLRMESFDENGKISNILIVRMDQKVIYSLNENMNTYVRFLIPENKLSAYENLLLMGQGFGITSSINRERQGTETVNGYRAAKFLTTTTIAIFGEKMTAVSYEWIAAEFDWPLRTQDDEGTVEMHNIKIETPGDSLFEIPASYKRDSAMEELFKDMGS